jgi:hypothetical protein
MRVTIIPSDGFVSIDGYGFSGLNLSSIDPTVHAVQWYDTYGEIEIKNPVTGRMVVNTEITSLEQFQVAIDIWNSRKEEILAAEAEAQVLAEAQAQAAIAATTSQPLQGETP